MCEAITRSGLTLTHLQNGLGDAFALAAQDQHSLGAERMVLKRHGICRLLQADQLVALRTSLASAQPAERLLAG